MPRGITQSEVFAAADRLLAAGERPTVERIRAVIGSGSPNTVIRYLDAWWSDAGHRLKAKANVPDLPPSVAELAIALWAQAVDAANERAQGELSAAHAELAAERERLDADKLSIQAEAQRHMEALARAEQAMASQTAQLVAWAARAADWDSERERMLVEAGRLTALSSQDRAALDALRDQHANLQQQAEQERVASAEHVRVVEDRAHTAVDTARQELKALRQQVVTLQRDAARAEAALGRERATHAKSLATAERESAAARAKAQALEGALATFKSSLRVVAPKKPSPRPRSTTARKTKAKH